MKRRDLDIYDDARIVAQRHREKGFQAGVGAAVKALKADARLCDCAALEANECACGAWDGYKSITSARAIEIVLALKGKEQ